VEVRGAGFHTLKDVTVDVAAESGNVGIQTQNDVNLSIIGGEVRLTGDSDQITLIQSNGVLTATGLTVDMTDGLDASGDTNHTRNSTGIVLNAPGSLVTGSSIYVNDGYNGPAYSIGISVQAAASKSTVEDNTIIGFGDSIGIQGANNLFSGVLGTLLKNKFRGSFFGGVVVP